MAPPEKLDALLDELSLWCKDEGGRGRQRELAHEMGVSEPLVSSWLARRKTPTLKHYFKLRAFVTKIRHRRK